ncbi:disulfide isomerase DsbC N-terminal domain-containing protein [Aliidiomarina sp. Khilg15.8]
MRTGLLLSALLFASPALAVEDAERDTVTANLAQLGLQVESVEASEVEGFYEVVTNQGLLYTSKDAKYLFAGQIFNIENDVVNLTEVAQSAMRIDKIAALKSELIVFPAPNEKHRITVFTDPTCGYCQRMHSAMDDYHNAGITIQYAAFPRAGMGSDGSRQLEAVFCADDQQAAMDAAKAGNPPRGRGCDLDIEAHLNAGRQLGVTGTPAVILPSGRLLAGFRPARAILSEIENDS